MVRLPLLFGVFALVGGSRPVGEAVWQVWFNMFCRTGAAAPPDPTAKENSLMLVRLMFVSRIRLLWNSSIPQKVQESAASFSSSRLQSLQDHSSHLWVKLQTQIHYYSQQDRANAGSITDGGCRELGAATRLDSVLIGRKSRSEVQLMNINGGVLEGAKETTDPTILPHSITQQLQENMILLIVLGC